MRLRERIAALEAQAPAGPVRVLLFFRDASGCWRDQQTGEPLPDDAELERLGWFAVLIDSGAR
jgi:hypothetical protein